MRFFNDNVKKTIYHVNTTSITFLINVLALKAIQVLYITLKLIIAS